MLVDNILCNSGVDDISLSCQESRTPLRAVSKDADVL